MIGCHWAARTADEYEYRCAEYEYEYREAEYEKAGLLTTKILSNPKRERGGDMRSCQSWLHRHKADRGPTLHPMTKTTLHLEGASQSSAQFNGNVSRSWNYQREL